MSEEEGSFSDLRSKDPNYGAVQHAGDIDLDSMNSKDKGKQAA